MSDSEIRVGKIIDEAVRFVFSNFLGIIKVGWLPLVLVFGMSAAIAWTFWQPVVLAYIEMVEIMNVAMDAAAETGKAAEPDFDPALIERALEETGVASLLFGYLIFTVVSIVGCAIPIAAYCRMFVLGESYGGPFYLRLGSREVGVALSYLAITLLVSLAVIAFSLAGGVVLPAIAAAFGESQGAVVDLSLFVYMMVQIALIVWLFARLGLAFPVAAIEGGVPIARAWQLTRAIGGRLAWAVALGGLIVMVVSMIAMMVLSLITGILAGALATLGSQMIWLFVGGVWVIGYVVFYSFSLAFFMALFTGPYKRLTEAGAA